MSTFTQFVGGGVPVGGFAPNANSVYPINFTANGQEWIQTGYLKSYNAAYAPLISGSKLLGAKNVAPVSTVFTTSRSYYQNNASSTLFAYTFSGTTYYYPWCAYNSQSYGTTTIGYSTSLTSATTAVTLGSGAPYNGYIGDVTVFNNRVLFSCNYYSTSTTGYDWLLSTTTGAPNVAANVLSMNATAVGNQAGYKVVASPTLCVLIANDLTSAGGGSKSGNIYTSTDGATWTARTNNINFDSNIYRAQYFASANLFIFVTVNGNIYTTSDGYTFTQRTSPTGMASCAAPQSGFYKNYSSAISGLAMFWLTATYFLYTTDGINYSITSTVDYSQNPLTYTLFPNGSTYAVGNDGTRILITQVGNNYIGYTTTGTNITLDFRRTGYQTYGFSNTNYSRTVSGFYQFGSTTFQVSEDYSYGATYYANITGTVATATCDLVGQPSAFTWASGSSFNTYLRIA